MMGNNTEGYRRGGGGVSNHFMSISMKIHVVKAEITDEVDRGEQSMAP